MTAVQTTHGKPPTTKTGGLYPYENDINLRDQSQLLLTESDVQLGCRIPHVAENPGYTGKLPANQLHKTSTTELEPTTDESDCQEQADLTGDCDTSEDCELEKGALTSGRFSGQECYKLPTSFVRNFPNRPFDFLMQRVEYLVKNNLKPSFRELPLLSEACLVRKLPGSKRYAEDLPKAFRYRLSFQRQVAIATALDIIADEMRDLRFRMRLISGERLESIATEENLELEVVAIFRQLRFDVHLEAEIQIMLQLRDDPHSPALFDCYAGGRKAFDAWQAYFADPECKDYQSERGQAIARCRLAIFQQRFDASVLTPLQVIKLAATLSSIDTRAIKPSPDAHLVFRGAARLLLQEMLARPAPPPEHGINASSACARDKHNSPFSTKSGKKQAKSAG